MLNNGKRFRGFEVLKYWNFEVRHGWSAVILLFDVKYDTLAMWETAENEEIRHRYLKIFCRG